MPSKWLHRVARRVSRIVGLDIEVVGLVPTGGLLVANHLGYLDIVALATITPATFVSKSDVKSWPVFGFFARAGGTIFVDRARRHDTGRANIELKKALASGELVVLFPEGTSTDGSTVRPFKSSLLEPVVHIESPVTAAHIGYSLPSGNVANEVCYWGDMTLASHLFNLLGKRRVKARVTFARIADTSGDRKELAERFHREVSRLKGCFREDSH